MISSAFSTAIWLVLVLFFASLILGLLFGLFVLTVRFPKQVIGTVVGVLVAFVALILSIIYWDNMKEVIQWIIGLAVLLLILGTWLNMIRNFWRWLTAPFRKQKQPDKTA